MEDTLMIKQRDELVSDFCELNETSRYYIMMLARSMKFTEQSVRAV